MEFSRLALRKRAELPNSLLDLSSNQLDKIDDEITSLASDLARQRNRSGFAPQPLSSHGIMIEIFLDELNIEYDEFAQMSAEERKSIFNELLAKDEIPETDNTVRYMDDGTVKVGKIGESIKRHDDRYSIRTWDERKKRK